MNNILRYALSIIIGGLGGITSVYIGISTSLMIPLIIFTGIIDNLQSVIGTTLIPIISPVTIACLLKLSVKTSPNCAPYCMMNSRK